MELTDIGPAFGWDEDRLQMDACDYRDQRWVRERGAQELWGSGRRTGGTENRLAHSLRALLREIRSRDLQLESIIRKL